MNLEPSISNYFQIKNLEPEPELEAKRKGPNQIRLKI